MSVYRLSSASLVVPEDVTAQKKASLVRSFKQAVQNVESMGLRHPLPETTIQLHNNKTNPNLITHMMTRAENYLGNTHFSDRTQPNVRYFENQLQRAYFSVTSEVGKTTKHMGKLWGGLLLLLAPLVLLVRKLLSAAKT